MRTDPNLFSIDVVFSFSPVNRKIVRQLAARLEEDGVSVCWDHDQFQSHRKRKGYESFKRAAGCARTMILVLSKKAIEEHWERLHAEAVLFRGSNALKHFVPLVIDDIAIPDAVSHYSSIDWRSQHESTYRALLETCKPVRVAPPSTQRPISVTWGHRDSITDLIVTSDHSAVFSVSSDGAIRSWQASTGQLVAKLPTHIPGISALNFVSGNRYIVLSTNGTELHSWNIGLGSREATVPIHDGPAKWLAASSDKRSICIGYDRHFRLWTPGNSHLGPTLPLPEQPVAAIAIGEAAQYVAWTTPNSKHVTLFHFNDPAEAFEMIGHSGPVKALAIRGTLAASGSEDMTVRVWDLPGRRCVAMLEGHVGPITRIELTQDGTKVISGSADGTVRIWSIEDGDCIATISHGNRISALAATDNGLTGAFGDVSGHVGFWDLTNSVDKEHLESACRYTNAKVLLVGSTGVGKTCLAHRLTANDFNAATISTDGVWATQLKLPHTETSRVLEKEIWLWDFAGQSDYRLIHQLFFDETALALLVFNPQSDDPFEGLEQWARDITRAARRPFTKLLVAGRCDRGGLMVSRKAIEAFLTRHGFADYVETSAATGRGCDDLKHAIVNEIQWSEIPWTSSPRLFKRLKDAVLQLKDESTRQGSSVLLRMGELRQQLQLLLPDVRFSPAELDAVVALLAGPGIVWRLEFGDFVLLQPERINAYAAAVIRTVRSNTDEIGIVDEDVVLRGDLDYQDVGRLQRAEEQVVLRAMHHSFVSRGICLREHTDRGTILIFPSHFRRERPELVDYPARLVTYRFRGQLEETYASLVAKLHYTSAFEKEQLWRFAADFSTPQGMRAGFKMTRVGDDEAELVVYFDPQVGDELKVTFIRYIHDHLQRRAENVARERHYVCPQCGSPVENRVAVQKRLKRGDTDIACPDCEQRVTLYDLIEQKFASSEVALRTRQLDNRSKPRYGQREQRALAYSSRFCRCR